MKLDKIISFGPEDCRSLFDDGATIVGTQLFIGNKPLEEMKLNELDEEDEEDEEEDNWENDI